VIKRSRFLQTAIAALLACGVTAAVAQQSTAPAADLTVVPPVPRTYKPAKTAWGEPDLRGIWPIDHLNGTPMQRDPAQGNRLFLTDEEFRARTEKIETAAGRADKDDSSGKLGQGHWVEMGEPTRRTSLLIAPGNGRLPEKTAEGKRRSALMRSSWRKGQTFDWVTDFDSWDRCITRGMPASMLPMQYNNGIRIFQAPGMVVLSLEMIHDVRIIPTDGRPAAPDRVDRLLGESTGRWENGNTLVVETSNLASGPSATSIVTTGSPPENDTPISDEAKIVERFTMTGANTIVYEMTYTDPVIFTAPWTVRLDWQRNDKYQFFEYACHEGNVQLRNYITASRAERSKAQAAAGKAQ
jgi:hypothetical protein